MISLPVTQPFPWDQLLSYLSTRCIPSFEYIDNQCFNRLHNGKNVIVSFNRDAKQLEININPNTKNSKEIYRRVEQLFYPALSTDIIYKHLSIALPESKMMKGFRPIGCWAPLRPPLEPPASLAARLFVFCRFHPILVAATAAAMSKRDL